MIAIDSRGNEIMESFQHLKVWDKPEFEYGMMLQDHPLNLALESINYEGRI
jgi:hypothetical protein